MPLPLTEQRLAASDGISRHRYVADGQWGLGQGGCCPRGGVVVFWKGLSGGSQLEGRQTA